MSDIQVVERLTHGARKGEYSAYYEALLETLVTGQAIRVTVTRNAIAAIRIAFRRQRPSIRLVTRTRPDGTYMWAEHRTQKPEPTHA